MIPYVKSGGVWLPCQPWVKSGGVWKRTVSAVRSAGVWKSQEIFKTDFREYALGVAPPDWSSRWGAGLTFTVQASTGSISGNALRYTKTAVARNAISWDRVPNTADVEILIRMRAIEAWAANDNMMGILGRGSGAAGSENGYRTETSLATSGVFATVINKYIAGAATLLGTQTNGPSPVLAVNDWLWLRVRINGTSVSRKIWHQGAAEPAAFDETITDSSIAAAGWVGLSQASGNPDVEIDYFSVALNGKTAI